MSPGRALAQLAVTQVRRLAAPAEQRPDARSQIHVMPEKDFFDCRPPRFYNCRVLKTNEIVGVLTPPILSLRH